MDSYVVSKKVEMTGSYDIVSNEILSVFMYGEGQGTLSFSDRVVKGDVVILKGNNNGGDLDWWLVPENVID